MGKISCKVCGTIYPDTSNKCPICGSGIESAVRVTENERPGIAEKKAAKGGYFSKENVRKRTENPNIQTFKASGNAAATHVAPKIKKQTKQESSIEVLESVIVEKTSEEKQQPSETPKQSHHPQQKQEKESKAIPIILTVLVLTAVILFGIIVIEYILPFVRGKLSEPAPAVTTEAMQTVEPSSAAATDAAPSETTSGLVCTAISLNKTQVELANKGEKFTLDAIPTPFNTTDAISYATSDASVAVVTENGVIEAVGNGVADITVSCGNISKTCRVTCNFDGASSTVAGGAVLPFSLDQVDISLFRVGEEYQFNIGNVNPQSVIWSSDDEKVAKVDNQGVVSAVNSGTATITATYGDQKSSCIIRCNFDRVEETESEEFNSSGSQQGNSTAADYVISHIDVSITTKETFNLTLKDRNGDAVKVNWKSEDSSIASVDGDMVTGVSVGNTTVYCNYGGNTYRCIVRVY